MRISKIAVDRVVRRLDQKIEEAMARWKKKNPAPVEEMEDKELTRIAINDTAWRVNVIKYIEGEGCYGVMNTPCLLDRSPKARSAYDRSLKLRAPWIKAKDAKRLALDRAKERLLDEIIIDGKDLMSKVERFGEE